MEKKREQRIGDRIADAQKNLGLSQAAFAELLGVSLSTQKRYEKSERDPDATYLSALSSAGVDISRILSVKTTAMSTHGTDIFSQGAPYTPGPWQDKNYEQRKGGIEIRPHSPATGSTTGYAPIALVAGDKRLIGDTERFANARLIAASPEMLELLHELTTCLVSRMAADDTVARSVCAKAYRLIHRIFTVEEATRLNA